MAAYIVRRTLIAVFTIFVISFLSFIIIRLPEGDIVDKLQQQEDLRNRPLTPEEQEELRERFGLDRSVLLQYGGWIYKIIRHGDFGMSWHQDTPTSIRAYIADRLPYTILLSGFTILVTWSFAIPIGIYSAVRQHSAGDYVFTFLGFTGLAVPDFLLGLVLMYIFFAYFDQSVGGLFSGQYATAPWSLGKVLDFLKDLIIPAIVLGTAGTAGLIRIMRNNLLDELDKPYVVTARAKGQADWKVILKYPVRVAINPLVSGMGSMLPSLVSGSVIVSVVLSLPTLGPVLLFALGQEDQYLAGTIIMMLGAFTVVGVLISDLLLVVVDPRIKLTGEGR